MGSFVAQGKDICHDRESSADVGLQMCFWVQTAAGVLGSTDSLTLLLLSQSTFLPSEPLAPTEQKGLGRLCWWEGCGCCATQPLLPRSTCCILQHCLPSLGSNKQLQLPGEGQSRGCRMKQSLTLASCMSNHTTDLQQTSALAEHDSCGPQRLKCCPGSLVHREGSRHLREGQ